METEKFDSWAVVEIMGHTKAAGKATTKPFGGVVFLQLDIPETPTQPAFTKMINMQSVFSITPVTEEVAQLHANTYKIHPIQEYEVREAIRKQVDKEVEIKFQDKVRELNLPATKNDLSSELYQIGEDDPEELSELKVQYNYYQQQVDFLKARINENPKHYLIEEWKEKLSEFEEIKQSVQLDIQNFKPF